MIALAPLAGACGSDDSDSTTASGSDTTAENDSANDTGAPQGGGDGNERAYADVRTSYHHMTETGGVLAGAISKQQKLGDPNTKQAQTSVALLQLKDAPDVYAAAA